MENKFYGTFDGDINEKTGIGMALYDTAMRDDVNMFLELGTMKGASARCIASAFKNKGKGLLHTVELSKSRVETAKTNLADLPVVCYNGRTVKGDNHLTEYYDKMNDQAKDYILEKLLKENEYDAVFLDTCAVTQSREFDMIEEKAPSVKYILMHEPNHKCNDILESIKNGSRKGRYEIVGQGYDQIHNHANVMWIKLEKKF